MDMSFKDAQKLWSGIWHKEQLVNKKRRWLMQLPSQDTNEVGLKRFRKPRSLSNVFLAESFVRRDEVSSQAVKINVKRNYRALFNDEQRLHDFHNYMALSDMYILQSFFLEPSNLIKFHSTLDLLSNNALDLLANLVLEDKINFERTRPKMKKVIKNHFPIFLSASKDKELLPTIQQLYEILRNPWNYEVKQPRLMTSACSSTMPSIYKALELLDSMPIFALNALNRKLKGKKVIPRFPPSKIGYNKKKFVNRIRNRCEKLIQTPNNENSMPEELLKALSVIHLYFMYKTKCSDTLTTKFFSFSIETAILQNNIFKALWSLPKVTSHQIKALQTILGLLGDDSCSFLNDLKQYLLQYLLECDEIGIPSDVSNVLAILNQSSCSQPQICSKEIIEVETEAVLIVSIELNQIVSHLVSCTSTDEKPAEGLESDEDSNSDDFELFEHDYCSNPVKYQQQQKNGFSINGELETTGDSMPGICFISAIKSNDFELVKHEYSSNPAKYQQHQKNGFSINDELETTGDSMPGACFISAASDSCSDVILSETPKSINRGFVKKLKKKQDDIHDLIPHYKESMETSLQSSQASKDYKDISIKELQSTQASKDCRDIPIKELQSTQASKDCRDISIKELCDETSLVSYRLIGHMLNSFLLVEDRDVDIVTRHHLTGGASHSTTFQDKRDVLDAYGENVGFKALTHSIKNLLPAIPKRCTQRVEKLMQQL